MHSLKMGGMLAGTSPGVSITACKVRVCAFTMGNGRWAQAAANITGNLSSGCCRLLKHKSERLAFQRLLIMASTATATTHHGARLALTAPVALLVGLHAGGGDGLF